MISGYLRREIIGPHELYLGDCREILSSIPGGGAFVEAIVSDPPYGMKLNADFSDMNSKFNGSGGGHRYENIVGDNVDFDPAPFLPLARQFVLFGADYYLGRLPSGGSLSVWDKRLDESADKMFGSCYETVWFYPGRRRDMIRYKWAGIFGTEKEDIKTRLHPTQKPIRLMQDCIIKLKPAPQVILDPFMGSGTTGLACVNLSRRFIGIEIVPAYFDIACERIRAAQAQGQLNFGEAGH
jgi:site-specific DNA-methyltransferase (adenine-specific)/modification methylase